MNSVLIRSLFFVSVAVSVSVIYFVTVIQQDFEIFTNPEGPDTTDYFLTEEATP